MYVRGKLKHIKTKTRKLCLRVEIEKNKKEMTCLSINRVYNFDSRKTIFFFMFILKPKIRSGCTLINHDSQCAMWLSFTEERTLKPLVI